MTLCIAAECEHEGYPAIAMCCDWRAQTGASGDAALVGTEDVYKLREWKCATAMLAGIPTKAKELAAACRIATEQFAEKAANPNDFDLQINGFLEGLRQAVRKRKEEILSHFIGMKLGISLTGFQKLPSDNYLDTWAEVNRQTLGADILICCVTHEPLIVRVDRWGDVHWENNYFAIGEGSEIARALLCLQPWYASHAHGKHGHFAVDKVPLIECLYRIYEAKMAAHVAHPSSVGQSTTFEVLTSVTRGPISEECTKAMTDLFYAKHKVPDISACVPSDKILADPQYALGNVPTSELPSEAPDLSC